MTNEQKHTPGPWHYDMTLNADGSASRMVFGPSDMGPGVSEIVATTNKARANYVADAHLIAAAPDLLSALKDALRSSRKDFKHGPDGDRQHREAYAEQFAAIAKAEGKQS